MNILVKESKPYKFNYQKLFTEEEIKEELELAATNNNYKMQTEQSLKSKRSSVESIEISLTEEHNKSIKTFDAELIEYCPQLFYLLRNEDNVDYSDLISSLDPLFNRDKMLEIKESSGKSGSFFFFSHDNRFIIKTVKDHELKTLLGQVMKDYFIHIIKNPGSLLTRINGLYTIILGEVTSINFILMQNLNVFDSKYIKRVFDLKGSTVDRITKNIESKKNTDTLKDLDFMWIKNVYPDVIF